MKREKEEAMARKETIRTMTFSEILFERLNATASERRSFESEADRCRGIEEQIISLLSAEGIEVSRNPAGYSIANAGRDS